MDERHLLLLGILKSESSHGYHITEFIERNLNRIIALKKTTAYSILDRLVDNALLDVKNEQEGNRPPRKTYSLTEKGEAAFKELLLDNLGSVGEMNLPQEVGIMMIDHLPKEVALERMARKQTELTDIIQTYESAPAHQFGVGVTLAVDHRIAILKAESAWLKEAIERICEFNPDGPEKPSS